MGTPPVDRQIDGWMDGWMDRHVSKHYLPVTLHMWVVIMGNVAKHHGKKKIMGLVPPLWTDRQTRVKTLPSRRTTYAGGNKQIYVLSSKFSFTK